MEDDGEAAQLVALAYARAPAKSLEQSAMLVVAAMGLVVGVIRSFGYGQVWWSQIWDETQHSWYVLSALRIQRQWGVMLAIESLCLAAAAFLVIAALLCVWRSPRRRMLLWAFAGVLVVHAIEPLMKAGHQLYLLWAGESRPSTIPALGMLAADLVVWAVPALGGIVLLTRRGMEGLDSQGLGVSVLRVGGLMALLTGVAQLVHHALRLPQDLEKAHSGIRVAVRILAASVDAWGFVGWLAFACAGAVCLWGWPARRTLMVCAYVVVGLTAWALVEGILDFMELVGMSFPIICGLSLRGMHEVVVPLAVACLMHVLSAHVPGRCEGG